MGFFIIRRIWGFLLKDTHRNPKRGLPKMRVSFQLPLNSPSNSFLMMAPKKTACPQWAKPNRKMPMPPNALFDLTDKVIVLTGATGTLTGSAAHYFAAQGARVVFLGRNPEKVENSLRVCREQVAEAQCMGVVADVLDRPALEKARDQVLET